MPSKRSNPKAYLFHIRDNITLAGSFVEGFDYERFRDNQLVFYGVTRALEIISEASRRLPAAMKARHPEFSLAGRGRSRKRLSTRLRGILRVQRDVWTTVQKHLSPLLAVVEQELRKLGELP